LRVIGYGGDTGIIDAVNSGTADFLLLDIRRAGRGAARRERLEGQTPSPTCAWR